MLQRSLSRLSSLLLLVSLSGWAHAGSTTVQIVSSKDNTLYEDPGGSLSSGAGTSVFAGRTGASAGGALRRAVLAFDVAGNIPQGSTIVSAQVDVFCSRSQGGSQTMSLHRVTADWGEGTSNAGNPGGSGAASTSGDATWIHTFFSSGLWASSGGDFDPAVSATTVVGLPDPYVFASAQLAADVQDMLDQPGLDFGWMMRGNEAATNTSKRFDSREVANPGSRPMLTVTYTPPPVVPVPAQGPRSVVLVSWLVLGGAWLLARRPA